MHKTITRTYEIILDDADIARIKDNFPEDMWEKVIDGLFLACSYSLDVNDEGAMWWYEADEMWDNTFNVDDTVDRFGPFEWLHREVRQTIK